MENSFNLDRRTFVAGSAVAAATVGLGLAGCGGGSDAGSEGATGSTATAAEGGTLTGACAYTSTNVNPIGNSSALMLAATWHVFEGLYDLICTLTRPITPWLPTSRSRFPKLSMKLLFATVLSSPTAPPLLPLTL